MPFWDTKTPHLPPLSCQAGKGKGCRNGENRRFSQGGVASGRGAKRNGGRGGSMPPADSPGTHQCHHSRKQPIPSPGYGVPPASGRQGSRPGSYRRTCPHVDRQGHMGCQHRGSATLPCFPESGVGNRRAQRLRRGGVRDGSRMVETAARLARCVAREPAGRQSRNGRQENGRRKKPALRGPGGMINFRLREKLMRIPVPQVNRDISLKVGNISEQLQRIFDTAKGAWRRILT